MNESISGRERDLRFGQYAGTHRLEARMRLHELFSTSKVTWQAWLHSHCQIPPYGSVLDVGCGNGAFWLVPEAPTASELTLCDLSFGMLRAARGVASNAPLVQASVCALPFRSQSFDTVLANHMLYHADVLTDAIGEIYRVLRPGGQVFASTVGDRHLQELTTLRGLVGLSEPSSTHAQRFGLRTGPAALRSMFVDVSVCHYPNRLAVTDVGPLLEYLESTDPIPGPQRQLIAQQVESVIHTHGHFQVTIDSGLVRARRPT